MRNSPGKKSLRREGFVLLEMVVVMGLLIFIFTLYFSRGSVKFQKQQQAACRQNLQLILVALQTYANDHKDKFPVEANAVTSEVPLSHLVPKYTTRSDLFVCPGSKQSKPPQSESFRERRIGYAYVMGLTAQSPADQFVMSDSMLNTLPKKAGDLAFSADGKKPANNHEKFGGVILFVDGRAEISPPKLTLNLTNPPQTQILNPKP